ncbi:MAG: STAS domain-containing protein [Bacteroidia bacterium]
MSFTYTIRTQGHVVIASLVGEIIDRTEGQNLLEEVEKMVHEGHIRFVFELSEVKYMNSTGLNVLINVLTKARKEGGEVIIAGVSKKVNELLLITKLNTVFTVTNTVEEALERLN